MLQPADNFELLAVDPATKARRGRLHTAHVEGDAETLSEAEPLVLHSPRVSALGRA